MSDESFIGALAIVFGVCVPFSVPILFLVLNYRKRRRMMELHHVERMAAIERGIELPPLPPDLVEGKSPASRKRSSLLPGLIWFFVGVALLIGAGSSDSHPLVLGLVPTGLGLAYLIYYMIEGRKLEREQLLDQPLQNTVK